METKVCTKCKIEKRKDLFRLRTDKRRTPYLVYYEGTCKRCNADAAMKYYNARKDLEWFKKKNCAYQKKRREQDVEAYNKKTRERKANDPDRLVKMREYRAKNIDKIREQERPVKRAWMERHPDRVAINRRKQNQKRDKLLNDCAAVAALKRKGVEITPENIKQKKREIVINRIKRALKKL